mmetsp:Transcript_15353/g.36254  ORF Transcript_15353/g.36254 Transcript_15353/m.36254 type:complete len:214 (+) Transcript_15353:60-701(+)
MAAAVEALNTVVFMGSARNSAPPWGQPILRLGTRVLKFVVDSLQAERPGVKHNVTVLDPLELQLPVLERPHFFYKPGEAPEHLDKIAQQIAAADCYVFVSAEYNHCIPPALANMLDYFGGSKYAFKCSGIVTYSSGQWGGMRAAMNLRAMTGELGCISVSNLVGVPNAASEFGEDGTPVDKAKWDKMLGRMLSQLEWTAVALKNHRAKVPPPS